MRIGCGRAFFSTLNVSYTSRRDNSYTKSCQNVASDVPRREGENLFFPSALWISKRGLGDLQGSARITPGRLHMAHIRWCNNSSSFDTDICVYNQSRAVYSPKIIEDYEYWWTNPFFSHSSLPVLSLPKKVESLLWKSQCFLHSPHRRNPKNFNPCGLKKPCVVNDPL